MVIRRATVRDLAGIEKLLGQVLNVHHVGRPDLFRAHTKKYTTDQLIDLIKDDTRPIFVACSNGAPTADVLGYAFCIFVQHLNDNMLTDIKTLYIDDLCVDEQVRGMHIGTQLYDFVLAYAREQGCYNVTLNVWALNEGARKFYESRGLSIQKYGMEVIL